MTRKKLTWYEFFAGGGMARMGLGSAWHCAFANDFSEKKAAAYRAYFGERDELKVDDVRRISTTDLPGIPDLVWASFPCQDLSLAGSGAGLNGQRSGTFSPFWKLIRALIAERRKPRIVVLENVVGAISSHRGKDFLTLVRALSQSGYLVGPLVIDAVHFLPQSRPRLFIVATSRDEPLPSHLTLPCPDSLWHTAGLVKAHGTLPPSLRHAWIWWNLPRPIGNTVCKLSSLIEHDPSQVHWHTEEETAHLISMMSAVNRKKLKDAQRAGIRKIGTVYRRTRPLTGDSSRQKIQRAEARFDEISGCLRTPAGGSSRQTILVVEGNNIRSRLLSPREAARLMGVPEHFPLPARYNDAYHLFGDGLAVPVVSWLEEHILRPLALHKTLEQVA